MTTATLNTPEAEGTLKLSIGGFSSKGIKYQNQDAFTADNSITGGALEYKGIAACIADGVSCSDNAQHASQTSVSQFIQDYYSTSDSWSVKESGAKVLMGLNSWLHHHGLQASATNSDGWVTTFSAAVFKSTSAHLFHVGDSRIYCVRDNKLNQLTRDHCHKAGRGKTYLSRALGMDTHLEVDYLQHEIDLGDIYLFTSDGVHEWVSEADIVRLLSMMGQSLDVKAESIVNRALANGSDDNASCMLARVDSLPPSDMNELTRELADLTIPPVLAVGNTIDDLEILKIIYSGTRSHVYLVEEHKEGRKFLLKAPSLNFAEDSQQLEGFIREQWVGQRISHPNVMRIFPRPSASPFLYHLCEPIEGTTLRQWMNDHPAPDLDVVRDIAAGIIRSIRAFQRMGMVHRDIKPENIMITPSGKVVLIDFGTVQVDGLGEVASTTVEQVPVGAVEYIAPEYFLGSKGGHCSDIYSLGVVVYEMLTSSLPYQISARQLQDPRRYRNWAYQSATKKRKAIPPWLDLTLKKACHELPSQRYQVMSEFELDLSRANQEAMNVYNNAPILERNPIAFWKSMALLFFLVTIIQTYLLIS